ncbi:MAG TPA: glycosyltransferase family 9 protein [Bacteroidia bacterium]|jgi:heptosyltransferase-3|nr:glycosyltransferase family 9 protein [Bacteroidia bacterium]
MQKLPDNFSIILSRTDSIGDVVLTLPMAGYIKKYFPKCRIIFLGRNYTKDVVALSEHVDEFISWDETKILPTADVIVHVFPVKEIARAATKSGIGLRVGTKNRLFHWGNCNALVNLSRKNSPLHESQLNIKLLEFLNIPTEIKLEDIKNYYGFTKAEPLDEEWLKLIDKTKTNVILHPKSKGSAREWGLDNFSELISSLPENKFKIFVSGTKEEGEQARLLFEKHKNITDLTGKLNLKQFISFINKADALVAASTGPLHIASALGKKAIGLFAPMRPIHPGRWMPIGKAAHYLVLDKECMDCKKNKDCHCIREIKSKQIVDLLS